MSIFDKQLQRKTDDATLETLRKGRVPSAREVYKALKPFIDKADSGPTFRPQFQGWRRTWDYKATNNAFKDIKFDLAVAYDEVVDKLAKMIRRLAFIELAYNSQKTQVETLIGQLRNLLFVSKNAEDNFFGVHDTFNDLSKVNLTLTSRDAVDLSEGVVLLPANDLIADKVDMSHLFSRQSWPVTVREITPGSTGVQNEIVPQSPFGNAFSDFIASWRQIVTIGNNGGVEITFTIPISGVVGQEISISRIGLTSSSANEMSVQVLHSLDNVNYKRFSGVAESVSVPAGTVTNIDFETTKVEFVRFVCRLDTPTIVDGASFGYVFGFRNISFYKIGRTTQAEFISKPLTPTGIGRGIDRLSMNVVEELPRGCSIDYFVAADDGTGQPREGVWRPITPLNRASADGLPKVVRFGNSQTVALTLPAIDPSVLYSTVRGVGFYKVNETALEHTPIFHSARLYRGQHAWYRNTQRNPVIREARDAFIDFTSGDVQNMYAVATQQPDVSREPKTNGGANLTALKVDRTIDYNVSTMLLIPGASTNPETDQRPRYAIYKIQRLRDNMVVSGESVAMPSDYSWKQMGNFGIEATGTGRPVVKNSAETVTYKEGKDYELELESAVDSSAPNVLSGRIRRMAGGAISASATIKVSYTIASDVTYMVDSIRTDKIFLKKDLGTVPDQYFLVTFRFIPRAPYTIRKSTLNVTSTYGSTSGTVFAEGPDYIVDATQGTITRVPTGKIIGTLQVYIDFQYEEQPPDLDTFTTWVRVDKRDPVEINFSPVGIDIDGGERIVVDGVNVSGQTKFPALAFGWHQVTVRSKRPESIGNAAVKLAAALTDRDGDPVFVSGGKYFVEMTASREPMFQRTYTQLSKGTPKGDHNYFSITSDGYVVVNFEPGTTEEIYSYGYRRNAAQTFVLDTWPEDWYLEYSYETDVADPVEAILLRALLSRGVGTDGGVTPKLHEYHIRIS